MSNWKLDYPAKLVAKWEGYSRVAFLDTIASPAVVTGGYGHTGPIKRGGKWRELQVGDIIPRKEALKLLAKDLRTAARAVNQSVHVPLTTRQRMALISLAFNIGVSAFQHSTLVIVLNERRYGAAAAEFLKWKYAGGMAIPGLLNRRRAEKWIFVHPRSH